MLADDIDMQCSTLTPWAEVDIKVWTDCVSNSCRDNEDIRVLASYDNTGLLCLDAAWLA